MPSTTCLICKRSLSDEESIERGMGPVCYQKHLADLEGEKQEQERKQPLLLFEGDIVCKRFNGEAVFNIPQLIIKHSPTGMEWGYGGSGPADLALNILFAVTGDKELAFEHYQQFKWDFVARLPHEGGVIKKNEILAWLEARKEKKVPA